MDSSSGCVPKTDRRCCRAVVAKAVSACQSRRARTPVDRRAEAGSRSEALPKEKRLAKRREFLRVYEAGRKLFSRYAVLFFAPNELSYSRLGITATKKMGKANARNRLKRWTREVYRRRREPLGLDGRSLDFVVNVKANAAKATYLEYAEDLGRVLQRVMNEPVA